MTEAKPKKRALREVVRVLRPVLKPRFWEFGLGIVLVFGSTFCEIVAPILLGKGVDVAISSEGNRQALIRVGLLFLTVITFRALTETFQGLVIQRTGQKVIHDLRVLVFEKVHSLPILYFDSHPTGRILTRVINDIKALSEMFTASISVLVLDVMIILGSIISMLLLNWKLGLVVLVSFPLVFWTIWIFGSRLSEAYKKVRARLAEVNAFLGENIGAVGTIQRLGAEDSRFNKFEGIVDGHTQAQMASLKIYASVQPYANILNGFAMASLMGVGGYWAIKGEITLGVLVAFFAYLRNLYQPIRDLVEKYNTFLSAMVAADRVVALIEEPSEPIEKDRGSHFTANSGDTSVKFEGVTFRYPARDNLALDQVSFEVETGQSLAIVGATGSGKSTIIRLLMRFYEPQSGEIQFGGKSLANWNRQELRRQIGVVQQEVYLFSGTVRDNLSLGGEPFEDSFLESQCRKTHFWELIKNRGGLEMIVAEGGSNLSLGERQLLALTRMWVFNPRVLILDEATASVDPISERYLLSGIKEGVRGRTSIVIAHRLSTIQSCDSILVIDRGKVAEWGTYQNLIKKGGVFDQFHKIYSHQGERRNKIPT